MYEGRTPLKKQQPNVNPLRNYLNNSEFSEF